MKQELWDALQTLSKSELNSELAQKKNKGPTQKEVTFPKLTESRIYHLPKSIKMNQEKKMKREKGKQTDRPRNGLTWLW